MGIWPPSVEEASELNACEECDLSEQELKQQVLWDSNASRQPFFVSTYPPSSMATRCASADVRAVTAFYSG